MPLFITVTPGTTVSNTTVLDPTVLNLLGNPAIDINGTVDGGSLSLAAGSVTTTALADGAVTFPKIQTIGTDRLLGRDTSGTGIVEELTVSGGLGFTGGGGIEITNNQVGYGKIQQVTGSRLLGNPTGSSANVSEIPLGTGLAFQGGALVNTGVARYRADFCVVDWIATTSPVLPQYNDDVFPDGAAGDYPMYRTQFVPTNFQLSFWCDTGVNAAAVSGVLGLKVQYSTNPANSASWTDVSGSTVDALDAFKEFLYASSTVTIGGSPAAVYWRLKWINTLEDSGSNPIDATFDFRALTLSVWN